MSNANSHIEEGLIEAYVLGIAGETERTEIERLRKMHPEVETAIIQFELQLEKRFLEAAHNLPSDVKQQIKEQLNFFPEKKSVSVINRRRSIWQYAAAASFALLMGSAVFHVIQNKKIEDLSARLSSPGTETQKEVQSLFTNPSITPVAMYGYGTHAICRCTLFWDKKTGQAKMMVHHLIPPPSGKNFQVWAIVNGKQVPAGTITTSDYSKMILLENIPGDATEFLVTLEPKGNTTIPTLSELYLKGVTV